MTLKAGTRLGRYEIAAQIGAGGMGEVYRATDTRLDRAVAVKVLPAELSLDWRFKLRFEREARTISQLQHPNVCSLFDVGSQDGVDYLVMELLEGETLEHRLGQDRLATVDALRIGREIAEGLEAAHRRGIVHRDLKPANVMLTADGVKLLDFGLARPSAGDDDSDSAAATMAATLVAPLTAEGRVAGTLPYMAPEQVKGRPLDRRTDLWALGCVLYQMFTGSRPFSGDSDAERIASILHHDPEPPSRSQPRLPARADWVIQRCLERDPERRWQSARDLAIELDHLLAADGESIPSRSGEPSNRPRLLLWLGAIAVALVIGILGGRFSIGDASDVVSPERTTYLVLSPPEGTEFGYRVGPMLNISRDGRRLAYTADVLDVSASRLYLHDLSSPEPPRALPTSNPWIPFFSSDGDSVGYFERGRLMTQSLLGGEPREVTRLEDSGGVWWQSDGTFLVNRSQFDGLERVSVDGATRDPLSVPERNEGHRHPQPLPDGSHVLVTVTSELRHPRIEVLSLADGSSQTVLDGGFYARYVPTGHLVFAETDTLMAVAIDERTWEVKGRPVAVVEGVVTSERWGHAEFAISDDGTLAYYTGSSEKSRHLTRLRPGEPPEVLSQAPGAFDIEKVSVSPDGRRLALSVGARDEVWIFDLEEGHLEQAVSRTPGLDFSPVWSPDGMALTWLSGTRNGLVALTRRIDGVSVTETALPDGYADLAGWSPDGGELLFVSGLTLQVAKSNGGIESLESERPRFLPALSSDGRWISYITVGGQGFEIEIASYPNTNETVRKVSNGYCPRWSADGRQLFFGFKDGVYVVNVDPSGTRLEIGPPRPFVTRSSAGARVADDRCSWDVTPDGSAVIAVQPRPRARLVLVEEWFEKLKRLVPVE